MSSSEHQHHHHHHHHHHHMDDASRIKHDGLLSIKRRRLIGKWLWRALVVVAILMAIATVVIYKFC